MVEQRELTQWFFKISDYSEELLSALDTLDRWPEKVRLMQKNWIGRSEGLLVRFARAPLPNEGSTTFLFIGRLLADKGVREFVSAARMVREQFPDVRFELLGGEDPGNRTAIPSEEIAAWKREFPLGNLHFHGFVPRHGLSPFINRLDVCLRRPTGRARGGSARPARRPRKL